MRRFFEDEIWALLSRKVFNAYYLVKVWKRIKWKFQYKKKLLPVLLGGYTFPSMLIAYHIKHRLQNVKWMERRGDDDFSNMKRLGINTIKFFIFWHGLWTRAERMWWGIFKEALRALRGYRKDNLSVYRWCSRDLREPLYEIYRIFSLLLRHLND